MKRLLVLFFLATAAARGATNFAVLVNGSGTVTIGTNWHGTQVVFSASTPVYVGTNRLATISEIVAGTVTTNDLTNKVEKTGDTMTGNLRVPRLELSSSTRYLENATVGISASAALRAPNLYAGWSNASIGIIAVQTTNDTGYGTMAMLVGTNYFAWYSYPTQFPGARLYLGNPVSVGWNAWTVNVTDTNLTHVGDIYATKFWGSGAGLTSLDAQQLTHIGPGLGIIGGLLQTTNSAAVSLTTNLLLVLDSNPGDWFTSRQTSGPTTNNSVTPPVLGGYVTVDGRTFPYARLETSLTNTWQTRTVFSRMVEIGEVATNVAAVRIVFPGASASSTQTVSFLGPTSNVFATVTLTNSTNYDITASLFATNRRWHAQIHGWVPPASGTNTGWLAVPRAEFIKQ